MNLVDTSSWKMFAIHEFCETIVDRKKIQVPTGAYISKKDLSDNGTTPRITVTGVNNGVSGFYDFKGNDKKDYRVYNNFISVSFLGTVFYQKGNASLDMKVHCVKPLGVSLNDYTGQFLVAAIKASLREGTYADQLSSTVLPTLEIKLPQTEEGNPDWVYMENYIKNLESLIRHSIYSMQSATCYTCKLKDVTSWKSFPIKDWFKLSLPKGDLQVKKIKEGNIPLVTPSNTNNGIIQRISEESESTLYDADMITVDMFGNSYFQEEKFFVTAHGHVNVLIPLFKINRYIGLYLASAIKAMFLSKYGFSDMCTQKVLNRESLILPESNGCPDWEYMEKYMKAVENNVKQKMDILYHIVDTNTK